MRQLNLRGALVVAQVALAFMVLVGAGLFIKSLRNLFLIDPGFKTENVLLVPIELDPKNTIKSPGANFSNKPSSG